MLFFVLIFVSCVGPDADTKKINEQKGLQFTWPDGGQGDRFDIIVIDSCEYIGRKLGYSAGVLTHKGNCKFCASRK